MCILALGLHADNTDLQPASRSGGLLCKVRRGSLVYWVLIILDLLAIIEVGGITVLWNAHVYMPTVARLYCTG